MSDRQFLRSIEAKLAQYEEIVRVKGPNHKFLSRSVIPGLRMEIMLCRRRFDELRDALRHALAEHIPEDVIDKHVTSFLLGKGRPRRRL